MLSEYRYILCVEGTLIRIVIVLDTGRKQIICITMSFERTGNPQKAQIPPFVGFLSNRISFFTVRLRAGLSTFQVFTRYS